MSETNVDTTWRARDTRTGVMYHPGPLPPAPPGTSPATSGGRKERELSDEANLLPQFAHHGFCDDPGPRRAGCKYAIEFRAVRLIALHRRRDRRQFGYCQIGQRILEYRELRAGIFREHNLGR